MANLIVTVIAIALAAVTGVAASYFMGDIFSSTNDKAIAAKFSNEYTQVDGALQCHFSETGMTLDAWARLAIAEGGGGFASGIRVDNAAEQAAAFARLVAVGCITERPITESIAGPCGAGTGELVIAGDNLVNRLGDPSCNPRAQEQCIEFRRTKATAADVAPGGRFYYEVGGTPVAVGWCNACASGASPGGGRPIADPYDPCCMAPPPC